MNSNEEIIKAEHQRQNNCLKQRIIELEAETEQKEVKHQQLEKRLNDLGSTQASLHRQFQNYQEQVRGQAASMQQQMEEKNSYILMLQSQLNMVEQSNQNLSSLLRKANGKIMELMKELTDKNRFIKDYLEERHDFQG